MDIIFQSHPEVTIGSNTFINCPIILQIDDTPLIEVGRFEQAGYTTRFSIFHNDGTKIGVVKGKRVFLTKEGEKAKLKLREEPDLTVCELENKPIFELRKAGAAALKGWAELYAPEGVFIKVTDAELFGQLHTGDALLLPGGVRMTGSTFHGCQIGILIEKRNLAIGVASRHKAGDQS
jgi:hypothetical protein